MVKATLVAIDVRGVSTVLQHAIIRIVNRRLNDKNVLGSAVLDGQHLSKEHVGAREGGCGISR